MVKYDGKGILLPCITLSQLSCYSVITRRVAHLQGQVKRDNLRKKEFFRVTDCVCARERQYRADGEKYQGKKDIADKVLST